MTNTAVALDQAWDRLHRQPRFRPIYPNESVVRFLNRRFSAPSEILDIGCGAGRHLALAAGLGHTTIGTDLSVEGLRSAAEMLESLGLTAHLKEASFDALPLADQSCDGAVCWGVLNYGDRATFQRGVDEMHRVLRPDGWGLVVTRSTTDHRYGKGTEVEPHTYVLDGADTNEEGMMMHFLDRPAIDDVFAAFRSIDVDWIEHSAGGGTVVNSDWVIEVRR